MTILHYCWLCIVAWLDWCTPKVHRAYCSQGFQQPWRTTTIYYAYIKVLHFFVDNMHVALPSSKPDQWERTTEVKASALLSWYPRNLKWTAQKMVLRLCTCTFTEGTLLHTAFSKSGQPICILASVFLETRVSVRFYSLACVAVSLISWKCSWKNTHISWHNDA